MERVLAPEIDGDVLGRLRAYAFAFRPLFPRSDQFRQCQIYVRGLLQDGERKSVGAMSRQVPEGDQQCLQQFIGQSPWDPGPILRAYRAGMADACARPDGVIVIDDTGFAKKGRHSVGVVRQYSGTLGKIGNCQVAVSLHYASGAGDYPLALQLYLPSAWTEDPARLDQARVPHSNREFKTKWEIALELLDEVLADGLSYRVVVADAGYGAVGPFRAGLEARKVSYIVGLSGEEAVFAEPPQWVTKRLAGRIGRPPTRAYLAKDAPPPVAVSALATTLSRTSVRWRMGTKGWLEAEFAWVRVWPAHDWQKGMPVDDLQPTEEAARWLLVEYRPDGTVKYALSNLPPGTEMIPAVYWWKERWQVEQGYRQLKNELGLDHFEGRTWNGFHHHAVMTFLAYGFLTLERARGEAAELEDPEDAALGGPQRDARASQPYVALSNFSSFHPADSLAGHVSAI